MYIIVIMRLTVAVTGCADIVAPEHAWLERRGDTVRVACNQTSERWHLVCKGTEWIGAFGNCTAGPVSGRAGHGTDSSRVHDGNNNSPVLTIDAALRCKQSVVQ